MNDENYTQMSKCRDYIHERQGRFEWQELHQEERHFLNVLAFYVDVNCNGLCSIFFNSSYLGDMADELLDSLKAVGALKSASIFEHSFTFFPDSVVPKDLDSRVDVYRDCPDDDDPFDNWSSEFYTSAEHYSEVLCSYSKSNQDVFRLQ